MQRPRGAAKSGNGLAIGVAAVVFLSCGIGGWLLFGQKEAPEPQSAEVEDWDNEGDEGDEIIDERPSETAVVTPPAPTQATAEGPKRLPQGDWPTSLELVEIVPLNAIWRYWDQGKPLATTWRFLDFDDSHWKEGPAPLGYGEKEGTLATEVGFGNDPKRKYTTTLFRHSFTAPEDIESLWALWLRFQVDDGCVVYLNGQEVARIGMGDRQWPYYSQHSQRQAQNKMETEFIVYRIDQTSRLKPGENNISVRVHQHTLTSSDIRLALELRGQR